MGRRIRLKEWCLVVRRAGVKIRGKLGVDVVGEAVGMQLG
jgi:hypothetical protein